MDLLEQYIKRNRPHFYDIVKLEVAHAERAARRVLRERISAIPNPPANDVPRPGTKRALLWNLLGDCLQDRELTFQIARHMVEFIAWSNLTLQKEIYHITREFKPKNS